MEWTLPKAKVLGDTRSLWMDRIASCGTLTKHMKLLERIKRRKKQLQQHEDELNKKAQAENWSNDKLNNEIKKLSTRRGCLNTCPSMKNSQRHGPRNRHKKPTP